MTLTITLSDETEKAIERKAARLGLTASQYMQRLAEKAATPLKSVSGIRKANVSRPKTGAELLAELDALDLPAGYGDPAIDSPDLARQLRERFSQPKRNYLNGLDQGNGS